MVKKIASFLAYSLFFILALMYFTPKNSVYFLLEEQLKQRDIVIGSEDVIDSGFKVIIKNADLYFKEIPSANIDEISIGMFVVYNKISLKNILLSSTVELFAPAKIDNIDIYYTPFNPLNITAYAVGEFGELKANFNIVENHIHIDLKPSKSMKINYKATLKNMQINENGEFTYDKTF